ncbi:MAG: hypothetical protein AAGE18_04925 [Pseudomonadota bacterium]
MPASLVAHYGRRLGLSALRRRIYSTPHSPSADLYIANACADWIAEGRLRWRGPTVLTSDRAEVVVRHDARAWPGSRRQRLIYVIDDDWRAASADEGLSPYYRWKYGAVEVDAARWHLARADAAVVSSPAVAEAVTATAPGLPVHQINPHWSAPMRDLGHHDRHERIDIACLAGRVHRGDMGFLIPALTEILDARPNVHVSLMQGHAEATGHPRLHIVPRMLWPAYRTWLSTFSAHIALYPLLPTPFNAGRSVNKLIEHAMIGAAAIYSDTWPTGRAAKEAGGALTADNRAEAWVEAALSLIDDAAARQRIAAAGQSHAATLNDPAPQRALWAQLLA